MRKFMVVLMVIAVMMLSACNSLDGTTSDDIQKVKDGSPVTLEGK